MSGGAAAFPGGNPARSRRAGQVILFQYQSDRIFLFFLKNSSFHMILVQLVPRVCKCTRKKKRKPPDFYMIMIEEKKIISNCCREGVAAEPRAVSPEQDRPRRRGGHRHVGLQVRVCAYLRRSPPLLLHRSPLIRNNVVVVLVVSCVMQDLRCHVERGRPRAAGVAEPRRLAPHLAAGRHLRPRVRTRRRLSPLPLKRSVGI